MARVGARRHAGPSRRVRRQPLAHTGSRSRRRLAVGGRRRAVARSRRDAAERRDARRAPTRRRVACTPAPARDRRRPRRHVHRRARGVVRAGGAPAAGARDPDLAPVPYARNPIGHGMCAPTLVAHGSDEQTGRYLRPLFSGEEIWCQMFSEPGAGSDVAGLSARAVLDGEEWIVNGQKVWTTLAHIASYGLLVARTDPDQPKHKGLTYFIVDMKAPGVEVRPVKQMTGDAEFNEVIFA